MKFTPISNPTSIIDPKFNPNDLPIFDLRSEPIDPSLTPMIHSINRLPDDRLFVFMNEFDFESATVDPYFFSTIDDILTHYSDFDSSPIELTPFPTDYDLSESTPISYFIPPEFD